MRIRLTRSVKDLGARGEDVPASAGPKLAAPAKGALEAAAWHMNG